MLTDGEPLPDFDLHCPMLGLPGAFATDLATIPANIPYLRPYREPIEKWHQRLPQNGRMRVGLCLGGQRLAFERSSPLDCA